VPCVVIGSCQGGAMTLEEIEQELLQSSSESAVKSRPNGESVPMLTVEELERKLRGGQTTIQPSSAPSAGSLPVTSAGSLPVTRIPGLLPVVPGSLQVCLVHMSVLD